MSWTLQKNCIFLLKNTFEYSYRILVDKITECWRNFKAWDHSLICPNRLRTSGKLFFANIFLAHFHAVIAYFCEQHCRAEIRSTDFFATDNFLKEGHLGIFFNGEWIWINKLCRTICFHSGKAPDRVFLGLRFSSIVCHICPLLCFYGQFSRSHIQIIQNTRI